ncbi:xanthine dehydrogenase small subunit [Microlunatus soli]|uniref:Xanthine dehydrogenase small subunit n=1 Tax=Microlunatus soli TaxID=630515 RepID=A0A1H1X334_9ACTN|nr:FAD binding domain-containing protein [Microlunatus soli]SDT03763.1 xanthine dehydrogenase small subunit [Microlunatus soli]
MDSIARVVVNGELRSLDGPAHQHALDFLRGCGWTGCKEGCAEGECGACAVLVARPDGDRSRWTAVNACLLPAAALDGQEVITAEGLGTVDDLHPVQRELAVRGGSQCGYCTPGFVCSMAAEYYRPDRIAADAATDPEHGPNGFDLHALSGNLCRCTGYRPIRDAAYALGVPPADDLIGNRQRRPAAGPAATDLTGPYGRFRRPHDLAETLQILHDEPDTVPVAGSTDWGVEVNLRGRRAASVVAIDRLEELRRIDWTTDHVRLGAALTLSELERSLASRIPLLDQLFGQFASRLVRNTATLGGNLGTGSPIGDAAPALLALDATLLLASTDGERAVRLAEYFTGYRTSVRHPDELITAVRIPLPMPGLTAFHKIAKRRFDDISSVAIGSAFMITDGIIADARIGLGGVAATPLRATATEDVLRGRPWAPSTITEAAEMLGSEGSPLDDHRASARYRRAMLGTALHRLWHEHSAEAAR